MASSTNRRVVTQKSLERQNSKGDDPWCLICGVNLALEGRTYTIVSRHNNAELCDIFSRVLGAEFSPDYASNSVCNRCERQLRRLGRYNSIILARHEGEKLREQLEKNLARYGQKVIEFGHTENPPSPTTPVANTNTSKSETVSSSFGKSSNYEGHSSIRKGGKYSSRSVSSVHFEDDNEAGRRESAIRKYSAPEGVRKRESLSPFSEAERRREARRRKWSSASSTSEENTPASPTNSSHRSLLPRGVALTTHPHRDAHRSSNKSMSSDLQQISDQLTTDNSSVPQEPAETQGQPATGDTNTMEEGTVSSTDQAVLVEKSDSFDKSTEDDKKHRLFSSGRTSRKSTDSIENKDTTPESVNEHSDLSENLPTKDEEKQFFDNSQTVGTERMNPFGDEEDSSQAVRAERMNPFDDVKDDVVEAKSGDTGETDDDVFVSGVNQEKTLPRMDTILADDEIFTKLGSDLLKDSPQDSESPNDTEPDPSDFSADNRSILSEVEERITTKTKFKGAYYNIGSTEDLLQEFANEEIREKARWSQLTFTESVDVPDDPNCRPARPPRRSRSSRSSQHSQRKKGTKSQEEGDNESVTEDVTNGHDELSEVKANGVVLENQNESSVTMGEGNKVVKFDKDAPEGTDSQAGQEGGTTTKKSEKSPLIGKDTKSSDLRLKNGHESKLKDQFPGFLCCSIL